jgi:hypothetical protein
LAGQEWWRTTLIGLRGNTACGSLLVQATIGLVLVGFVGIGTYLIWRALFRLLLVASIWVEPPVQMNWLLGRPEQLRSLGSRRLWVSVAHQMLFAAFYGWAGYYLTLHNANVSLVGLVWLAITG